MDHWYLYSQAQVEVRTLHTLNTAEEAHTAFVAGLGVEVGVAPVAEAVADVPVDADVADNENA